MTEEVVYHSFLRLQEMLKEIEAYELSIKQLKAEIKAIGPEIREEVTDLQHREEIANHIYWHLPKVQSGVVCDILGVRQHELTARIGSAKLNVKCPDCGQPIKIAVLNRNSLQFQIQQYKNARAAFLPKCESCEKKQTEALAQRDEIRRKVEAEKQERLQLLASMPYGDYLQTEEWKAKRKAALKRAWYRCELCNASKTELHVHHKTYENRGNEPLSDLIVLCRDCHAKFHDKD